jgi:hypothetical protein
LQGASECSRRTSREAAVSIGDVKFAAAKSSKRALYNQNRLQGVVTQGARTRGDTVCRVAPVAIDAVRKDLHAGS